MPLIRVLVKAFHGITVLPLICPWNSNRFISKVQCAPNVPFLPCPLTCTVEGVHHKNKKKKKHTWYRSQAESGCFSLGMMTMVLPRTTAGANRDTKPSRGYSSGQAMPITPTGSWILTVAPYRVVSWRSGESIEDETKGTENNNCTMKSNSNQKTRLH